MCKPTIRTYETKLKLLTDGMVEKRVLHMLVIFFWHFSLSTSWVENGILVASSPEENFVSITKSLSHGVFHKKGKIIKNLDDSRI